MCLLILQHRQSPGAPVLLAANREEAFGRPSLPPAIQPGSPRVICGTDGLAGGTWLGVNEHALAVAVTNCRKSRLPQQPRSRGLLCRQLLDCRTAQEAAQLAQAELAIGRYAGANFVCADRHTAYVVHSGDHSDFRRLEPGRYFLANLPPDDSSDPRIAIARQWFRQREPDDASAFVQTACELLSRGADESDAIVLRGADRGTVSSTLIALTDDPANAVYRYTPGPPDRCDYVAYDSMLRAIL